MGVSTDAILFYGYCWEEEGEPFDELIEEMKEASELEEDFDLDDFILAKHGFREQPEKEYGKDPSKKDEWIKYFAEKREFLETLPEIIRHCHCDAPHYGIAFPGTVTTVERGSASEVRTRRMDACVQTVLEEFCKKLGVETDQTPKWWLVSYADY